MRKGASQPSGGPIAEQSSDDANAERTALMATLRDTQRRLGELTHGAIDTVTDKEGRPIGLLNSQEAFPPSEAFRQSAILNALPANISLLNARGVIVSVNEPWRHFAAANGMPDAHHGVGRNYLEICDFADGEGASVAREVAAGIRSVLSLGTGTFSIEYACHSPAEQRWFLVTVSPLSYGPTRGAVVMHQDVTNRRQAEQVLLESEERFSGAFEYAPIGVALVSADGQRWIKVNPALCKLFGYSEEELLARSIRALTHPDDLEKSRENVDREVADGPATYQLEKRYIHSDGHVIEATVSITLVRGPHGEPLYFVSHILDTTDRNLVQSRLFESEGRYRALVDWSPESIVVTRAGKILFVNEAGLRMMGASCEEEVLAKPMLEHVHPDWRGIVMERARLNAEIGGALPLAKQRFLKIDGTAIDVEVQSRSIQYDGMPATFSTIRDITERTRAEEELRASNEKFHQLADNITDVFWIRSPDMSEVHYVSPAFERIWGRPVESLTSAPHKWAEFIVPEDRERVCAAFAGLTRDTAALDVEYRIARPDGDVRWVRSRGFQVRDEAGTLIRNIGIVTDITENHRVAEELWATEKEFRTLAIELEIERSRLVAAQHVAKVGSWETDLTTLSVTWSEETQRIFESGPATTNTTHDKFLVSVHPDDRESVDEAFHDSLLRSTPSSIEHRLLLPDGRIKFVEERWQVVRDEQGTPIRAIGTCQDITERKGAEIALHQSRKRLRDIIDGLAPSMFVGLLTPEGVLVEINHSALAAAGLHADDVLGKPFAETQWWSHSPEAQKQLRDAVARASRGEASRYDVRTLGAGGKFIDMDFSLQPLRDESGQIVFLIPSASVITERKQAEAALRQAQKMDAVGQLAAGVAHEFNNILQTLMSMATITRMRGVSPEVVRIAGEMETQIRRGASVTQQLLLSSRHQELTKTSLDLRAEVATARALLRRLLPENIALVVATTGVPAGVDGDAGQIQQILLNLAINARDAMPDGGTLTLRVESDEREVSVEVEDDGAGFDEETRERLFEPFFTTKEVGKGTGLGLSVVYGIVEQHGGRIEVRSEPGHGSVFRVILPKSVSAPAVAPEDVQVTSFSPMEGRVLLVEDEDGVREGIAMLLTMLGYEVITASRGEEAMALPLVPAPDLLLSDVSLPGIGGPAMARRLRAQWPALRVTLMTGYADANTKEIAQAEGWAILEKPFELEDLETHLRNALGR